MRTTRRRPRRGAPEDTVEGTEDDAVEVAVAVDEVPAPVFSVAVSAGPAGPAGAAEPPAKSDSTGGTSDRERPRVRRLRLGEDSSSARASS